MKKYHDWREGRRFRAFELSQEGWGVTRIANALGVSKGAVSMWLTKARAEGPDALKHHPPPGRKPRLAPEKLSELPALLEQGPEAFGFRGKAWTRKRVAEVIARRFGIRYSVWQVGRMLRRLRHSPQKPVTRASERKEEVVEAWRRDTLPMLRKK